MSSVDAWLSLADRVALLREQTLRERLTDTLAVLLATSDDRAAVAEVNGLRIVAGAMSAVPGAFERARSPGCLGAALSRC